MTVSAKKTSAGKGGKNKHNEQNEQTGPGDGGPVEGPDPRSDPGSGERKAAGNSQKFPDATAKAAKSAASASVVVQSFTAKNAAPAVVRSAGRNTADKPTAARTSIEEGPSAAWEVDSKATSSGKAASAGTMDKVEKPVVLKVSEVATKTPKTTSATTLLTEEQILKMGEKDYMNEAQLAFFKARLQQLEKDLLKNADETTEHLRETVLVPDPADRATIEEEHALELRTRDRERKLLKKVQQSIASIDGGDYGWCEETGEPIGIPRLLARPTATLSLEAQQRRELKQKLYGD
jgi:DnaK suppressor protein